MRIAVVSNTAWYLSNFRLNLMRAIEDAGHTVVAAAPFDPYVAKIRSAGFEFIAVPISGGGTNPLVELLSVFRLWRLFRHKKIDLVLSFTPKGNLYSALAAIVAGIAFAPNVSGLGRAFIKASWITHIALLLYRLTFGQATRVFFENNDDLNLFLQRRLVRPERAERLPGAGIALKRFIPPPLPERPTDTSVFLLIARLLWDKGVGEYVEAARIVRRDYPEARFQLLGFVDVDNPSAVSRAQVDDWVKQGLIVYLGRTDDVRPHIEQADCIVLPSYREGLPQTLLEGAAMARIIVTTDVPGCRDTLIDGETGFLCRLRDSTDLADKLRRVLTLTPQQRRDMGLAGRAFVERHFDEDIVLSRFLDLIARMKEQRSRPGLSPS